MLQDDQAKFSFSFPSIYLQTVKIQFEVFIWRFNLILNQVANLLAYSGFIQTGIKQGYTIWKFRLPATYRWLFAP